MGKKVSWFSAIKKAFTPNSKQKFANDHVTEKKNSKWGLRKKHGGTTFIPLSRKPSSIEKILGDAEKEHQIRLPGASSSEHSYIPSRPYQEAEVDHNPTNTAKNQRSASSNDRQREPSIPTRVYHPQAEVKYNRANSTRNQRNAATRIQAAYRGHLARKNIRALKGMMRLQGVVRGHNVKRQTLNAMKQMQLLVKVQSRIQLRRINMLENLQHQNLHKNDRELENSLARWNLAQPSETDQNEEWDDSLLTIEEIEARTQRKAEALMKRERILAYASSKQWFKAGSTQMPPMELRSGTLPWWWIRIEQQLPKHSHEPSSKNKSTHPNPAPERSPRPQSKQSRFGVENLNSPTPTSFKQQTPMKSPRVQHSPILTNRTPQSNSSTPMQHAKPRTNVNAFSFNVPLRDDDSFTSCPPLSRPNYMTPTISAKAKLRAYENLNERSPATPTPGQKRRLSFPLTQSFGSIGWKRASSLFSNKVASSSQTVQGNHRAMSVQSIGNSSVDSTTSMPAAVGRKPFNRFV